MLCYATYIKVESDIIHTEYERLSEEERLQFDSELQQNTIFNAIPQELQLSHFNAIPQGFRLSLQIRLLNREQNCSRRRDRKSTRLNSSHL